MATRRSSRLCHDCGKGGGDLLNCTGCSSKFHPTCIPTEPGSASKKKPLHCSVCLAKGLSHRGKDKMPLVEDEQPFSSASADAPPRRGKRAGKSAAKETKLGEPDEKYEVLLVEEPAIFFLEDAPTMRGTRAGMRTVKEVKIAGDGEKASEKANGLGASEKCAGKRPMRAEGSGAAEEADEPAKRKRGRKSSASEGNPVTPSQELERALREKKGKAIALDADEEAASEESSDDEHARQVNAGGRRGKGRQVVANENGNGVGGPNQKPNRGSRRNNEDPAREGDRMVRNREQWMEIARRRAAHFAHFAEDGELGEGKDQRGRDNRRGEKPKPPAVGRRVEEEEEGEEEEEADEDVEDMEDDGEVSGNSDDDEARWPGPFAEARRLQRRRAKARAARQEGAPGGAKGKAKVVVEWTPSRGKAGPWQGGAQNSKELPTLFELCVRTLCAEVDAVVSLAGIPDTVRNRMSAALCDRRKLTARSMRLLFEGLPTEVSAFDCTLVTEPELADAMKDSSLERLEVLELAMCGRCLSDNLLESMVGKQEDGFACLNRLGLRGAYRLSDRGISTILKAAPALTEVELSQCSIITEEGVAAIADAVGPQLRRFSIEGCAQLRGPAILNSLLKMTSLEKLSLSGIDSMQDSIVCEVAVSLGSRLRELRLRRCSKLTDVAVAGVAACCPGLEVLDLDEIPLLTDDALSSLGEGCRSIRTLLLKNGKFSDEALSKFVSCAGASLRELSLNCVWQVEDGTMMELVRHSKETLTSLDVSFCRNISDAAFGLVADCCSRLRTLRMFGCSQATGTFLNGHSNEKLVILGRGDEIN